MAGPPRFRFEGRPDRRDVLQFELFNKLRRKAYVDGVSAECCNGSNIPITWGNSINGVGNITPPLQLIGIDDTVMIYVRRNDGEAFKVVLLRVKPSWDPETPLQINFDRIAAWSDQAERTSVRSS